MGSERWVVLQHVPHEGPGALAPAIRESGADLQLVRIDDGDAVPSPDDLGAIAGLVVLGGPMGVHDDLPWLASERALLRAAVDAGKPVLGVCLGAQQLAAALGADVVTGPEPECGVGEVHLTSAALSDPIFGAAPTPLPCVHWHQDTFSLPEGAVRLAGNEAYENQAFRVGARAYGLQFHVEVTGSLVAHWGPHLPPGMFVRAADVAHVGRAGEGIVRRFVALAGELVSVSAHTVRRLALALPEATEQPHHDMTSFRVRGKIFATMPPEGGRLHVFLPDGEVASYCTEFPSAVEELWWGKKLSGCRVILRHADRALVREMLDESWRRKAPKSLLDG